MSLLNLRKKTNIILQILIAILFLFLSIFFLSNKIFAVEPKENLTVRGTIVDSNGDPKSGIKVTAHKNAPGIFGTATTDSFGRYKINGGTYGTWDGDSAMAVRTESLPTGCTVKATGTVRNVNDGKIAIPNCPSNGAFCYKYEGNGADYICPLRDKWNGPTLDYSNCKESYSFINKTTECLFHNIEAGVSWVGHPSYEHCNLTDMQGIANYTFKDNIYNNFDFEITCPTDPPPPIQCADPEYNVYLIEKGDTDVTNTTNCDFNGANPITTTSQKEITINQTNHKLEWNKAYCWKVEAKDSGNVSSPIYTFRTNMSPELTRTGLVAENNSNNYTSIDFGGNIDIGTPKCTSGISGCDISNTSDYNNMCWVGGEDGTDDIDDTVELFFEYDDKDDDVNEAFRHKFALIKSDDPAGMADLIDYSLVEADNNKLFHASYSDLQNTPKACLNYSNCSQEGEGYRIISAKVYPFSENRQRLVYKIQFDKVPGISGKYGIYSLSNNRVDDPFGSTGYLPSDYNTVDPNAIEAWGQYRKVGMIGIDTVDPIVNSDVEIKGYNTFDIDWTSNELNGSGLLPDFNAYCFSTEPAHSSFPLNYTGPNGTSNLTIQYYNDIENIPTGYNECMQGQDKNDLVTNGIAKTNYSFPNTPIDSYKNFDHLSIGAINVKDMACNTNDPTPEPQTLYNPWLTTLQGTVHSDTSTNIKVQPTTDSFIESTNKLYLSKDGEAFYEKTDRELVYTSSDMLSSVSGNFNNHSRSKQEISGYNDINSTPVFPQAKTDWFEYFITHRDVARNLIKLNGNQTTVDIFTPKPGSCDSNSTCFYHIDSNLVASGNCDRQAIFLVEGDITVNNEFTNIDKNDACIFITKGNINFTNKIDPNQNETPVNHTPPKDSEGGTYRTTSMYDKVDGFFIAIEGSTSTTTTDVKEIGQNLYADGLLINGGMVGNEHRFNRDLGLRNNIQPAELITFDPRYMILYLDTFGYTDIRIRETY